MCLELDIGAPRGRLGRLDVQQECPIGEHGQYLAFSTALARVDADFLHVSGDFEAEARSRRGLGYRDGSDRAHRFGGCDRFFAAGREGR